MSNVNHSAVFIPDPNRWAIISCDKFVVFDVLGWRYDPATDTSEPVVSSRGGVGAKTLSGHRVGRIDGYYRLVPQWPGIIFGSGQSEVREQDIPDRIAKAAGLAEPAPTRRRREGADA